MPRLKNNVPNSAIWYTKRQFRFCLGDFSLIGESNYHRIIAFQVLTELPVVFIRQEHDCSIIFNKARGNDVDVIVFRGFDANSGKLVHGSFRKTQSAAKKCQRRYSLAHPLPKVDAINPLSYLFRLEAASILIVLAALAAAAIFADLQSAY